MFAVNNGLLAEDVLGLMDPRFSQPVMREMLLPRTEGVPTEKLKKIHNLVADQQKANQITLEFLNNRETRAQEELTSVLRTQHEDLLSLRSSLQSKDQIILQLQRDLQKMARQTGPVVTPESISPIRQENDNNSQDRGLSGFRKNPMKRSSREQDRADLFSLLCKTGINAEQTIVDTYEENDPIDFREEDGRFHSGYRLISKKDDNSEFVIERPDGTQFTLMWWKMIDLKNKNSIRTSWDFNDPYPVPEKYEFTVEELEMITEFFKN